MALIELTNNVMMRTIVGKRIHGEVEESDFSRRFKVILKELVTSGGAFTIVDFIPLLKYVGVQKLAEKNWRTIFVKLDKFLQDLVDEQRRKLEEENGDENELNGKNRNLVQVLLQLKKTDPEYATDTIIKGLVQILLLAGTETSASTMKWAIALLIKKSGSPQKGPKRN